MSNDKKYDAYVINLDTSTDRWAHMQSEFKDTIFNLIRYSALTDSLNRGWVALGKTYGDIVKKHMAEDPNFEKLLIIFEDDAFRTQDKETFNTRCSEIMKYLEDHKGEYSHFQGGGIYPQPTKIESTNPLLIRCDWIVCTTFNVIGKEAAETILKYQTVPDDQKEPIDNYLSANNCGKMLVPFPHLCWQLLGVPSTISNADQKTTLNEAFRNAHKVLSDFVKSNGITVMSGGTRKNKRKTLTFLQSAMKKFRRVMKKTRHHKVSLKGTRKSYPNAKAM